MLRFLSQSFDGGKSYYPEDWWTRAQIDYWLDWYGTDFRPVLGKIVGPLFKLMGKKAEEIPAEVKAEWNEAIATYVTKMAFLEEHLKKGSKFVVGDTPTLADFVIVSEIYDFWYVQKEAELEAFPCVKAYIALCEEQKGIKDIMGAESDFKKNVMPMIIGGFDADRMKV